MSELFSDIMDGLEYIANFYGKHELAKEIEEAKNKTISEELSKIVKD